MHRAINQFRDNLKRARELGALAGAIEALTTPAIDVSDLLRSQLVLAVSALDQLIHEMARLGMIDAGKGRRLKTDAYYRFQLPVTAVESAINGTEQEVWLGESVRERHSWQSFQEPDKIADAIRLISEVKLWETVGVELGLSPQDAKTQLKLTVDRRNKIAHEADMDPTNTGFRWPISASLVKDAVDFIERVAEAIFKVAN
jgi:RiboL-PSP-HEPN